MVFRGIIGYWVRTSEHVELTAMIGCSYACPPEHLPTTLAVASGATSYTATPVEGSASAEVSPIVLCEHAGLTCQVG